jgi:cysteine dioxygenase
MAVGTEDHPSFFLLVDDLKRVLGPSSGLTSDDVNVKTLINLMQRYDGRDNGWSPYYFAQPGKGYTRNLVDRGNGKANLVRYLSSSSWSS